MNGVKCPVCQREQEVKSDKILFDVICIKCKTLFLASHMYVKPLKTKGKLK